MQTIVDLCRAWDSKKHASKRQMQSLLDSDRGRLCYGPYPVTIIEHFKTPIADDFSLGSKIWFPRENIGGTAFSECKNWLFNRGPVDAKISSDDKLPVILEYIPYRKSDLTAQDDHGRYTWWCSYGYVCMRVDIRGTGDSDGLLTDEYSQEEQDDCILLMEWLDQQQWFNGKVGMIGISWGGFNGLQMAYLQPRQLTTVISLCSTDDRYKTDVHYKGGCLTGDGMISWGTLILAWNALPPDPKYTEDWKDVWLSRLQGSKPWMANWLRHQKRDNYWKHGSISQNYSRVKCPTLLFGGWRDPYRDSIFRMLENLNNVKAVIGPWGHQWPHTALPGPNIDFLRICLHWFDHHLKETNNNVMAEPKLRAYLQEYILETQEEPVQQIPGKWIAFDQWPNRQIKTLDLFIACGGKLLSAENKEIGNTCCWETVPYIGQFGLDYCEWVEMSMTNGPADQSLNNSELLKYSSTTMDEDYILFGNPEFSCFVSENDPKYHILMVQLLDEAPSGKSTMISYGVQNITPCNETKPLFSGESTKVAIHLHALSHTVPKGHRISLRVSSSFWPNVWCPYKPAVIKILTGMNNKNQQMSLLKLPVLQQHLIRYYQNDTFNGSKIAKGIDLPLVIEKPPHFEMNVNFLQEESLHTRKIINDHGKVKLMSQNVSMQNCSTEVCEMLEGCPDTAYIESEMVTILQFQTGECDLSKYQTSSSLSNDSMSLCPKSDKHLKWETKSANEEKGYQTDLVNTKSSNLDSVVADSSKSSEQSVLDENNSTTGDRLSNNGSKLHDDPEIDLITGNTVKVHTKSCLNADEKHFHLETTLTAELDGSVVHEQKWNEKIERMF